jgi:hypothetical protein
VVIDFARTWAVLTRVFRSRFIVPVVAIWLAAALLCALAILPAHFAKALQSAHPVKLLLMMTIIVSWALITILFLQPRVASPTSIRIWSLCVGAMGAISIVYGASWLWREWSGVGPCGWYLWRTKFEERGGPILAVALPLGLLWVLYVMPILAQTPSSESRGTTPNDTNQQGNTQ